MKTISKRGPALITWQDIHKITGNGETACRAELQRMKQKFGTVHISRHHMARYYDMPLHELEYYLISESEWFEMVFTAKAANP